MSSKLQIYMRLALSANHLALSLFTVFRYTVRPFTTYGGIMTKEKKSTSVARALLAKKAEMAKNRDQPRFPSSKKGFHNNAEHAARNSKGQP